MKRLLFFAAIAMAAQSISSAPDDVTIFNNTDRCFDVYVKVAAMLNGKQIKGTLFMPQVTGRDIAKLDLQDMRKRLYKDNGDFTYIYPLRNANAEFFEVLRVTIKTEEYDANVNIKTTIRRTQTEDSTSFEISKKGNDFSVLLK